MLISLFLVSILTAGGLSLTYLIAEDEPLLWRISAGGIIGSAMFGLVCFLLACAFGFSAVPIALAFLITLAPVLLFGNDARRENLRRDWQRAKGKLEGTTAKKIFRLFYYLFFFVLFCLFFERAILGSEATGIFTGASQNYGDLPFHLGAIYSFTEGNNFPPENPSYAFAKFSYPFMADLIAAAFVKFGATVRDAILVQNILTAFWLLVILERFVFRLTGNKLAGKVAPVLLFFSGGLGFVWFLKDYWQGAQSLIDFVSNLSFDYTIRSFDPAYPNRQAFRWGNSLVVLFVTQRSLLLGMPLTVIVLQKLWKIFVSAECGVRSAELKTDADDKDSSFIPHSAFRTPHSPLLVGLLAGTLPLVHVHSLAVLFVVAAFLFFFRLDKWREWVWFGIGVSLVAVPELVWAMTGSATELTKFVGWHFGWDKGKENFLWFWLKNTGIFIPLLIAGIYLVYTVRDAPNEEERKNKKPVAWMSEERKINLLLFSLPFFLCFFVSNTIKLAPWEWDNIKVLIYWFVGCLPIVAFVLAWLWVRKNKTSDAASEKINHETTPSSTNQNKISFVLFRVVSWFRFSIERVKSFLISEKTSKMAAVSCLIILTFSGALDVWRTVSRAIEYKVFDKDAAAVAEQIKRKTAPNALFLNAPTFNSAVVLSGRRSLMRYNGHLASYGIDYTERENEVKRIYAGDGAAEILLRKYGIEYVLVSPEEKSNLPQINEEFFRRLPVVAEAGQYRVYQVTK